MKKIMAVLSLCSVFAMALAFAGCSGEQTFESKNWESGDTVVKSVAIDVEDRAVEVIPSEDGQVHIEYSESEKEYYNISVSEDGELTMTFETNKTWTDYIGTKPAAEYRKIVVALPEGLSGITVSTTNETVDVSSLAVQGEISLNSNGGDLNFEKLETLFDKERNIELYKILKERLEQYNGDGKKAFSEPVYMKLSEDKIKLGQKPHPIKTVKLISQGTSGILLPNGFAKNDSMPRVDVFTKKNKKGQKEYYLVPIYVADFAKGILPNKAITRNKDYKDWINIDETFNFEFSLFKNTLISINKTGKPEDEIFAYYNSTHKGTGAINIEAIDNDINFKGEGTGVKTLFSIKKYQIDVLGKYNEVKHEKRQDIHSKEQ